MKSVLIRIKEYRPQASYAEQGAIEYLLEDPNFVSECTIKEFAEKSFSSASTIVRLCRKLGFEGFRDLQRSLSCELAIQDENIEKKKRSVEHSDSLPEIIQSVTGENINSLNDSVKLLDPEDVQKSVDLICSCDTLLLFGMGASYLVARDAFMKFLRVNKRCACCEDIHSQYVMAHNATPRDAAIIISYSGCTQEMINCAQVLQAQKTPIIGITRFEISPLTKLSTCCLYVASMEELFRSGAMSSRISQLNMIDILYTAFINRNFSENIRNLANNQIEKPV